MRRILFLFVFLFFFLFSFSLNALIQEPSLNLPFNKSPGKTIEVPPSEKAIIAFKQLKSNYPDAEVIWNTQTGTAKILKGIAIEGDEEEVIQNFIKEYGDLFGVSPDEIKRLGVSRRPTGAHYFYSEEYNGLPVAGTKIIFNFTKGVLNYISAKTYEKDLIKKDYKFQLTKDEALTSVINFMGRKNLFVKEYKRRIYVDENLSPRAVYELYIWGKEPYGEWLFYVDAVTGEVLDGWPTMRTTSGYVKGMVFPSVGSDPLSEVPMANEYVWVGGYATTTNSSGYYTSSYTGTVESYLRGPYVNAQNEDYSEAYYSTSSSSMDYSFSQVSYSWINTSTSTGITGDDQSKVFTLPFSFNFYGTTYNSVYVCSNGFLSFTSNSTAYRPADIPNTGTPNALIAPFWRDLTPDASGTITYTSTSSYFVVTWNNVKNYSNSSRQTFQVILYPSGEIVFQYKTVSNDVTTSIGIENQDGSGGKTASFPSNYTAYKFTPVGGSSGNTSWTWAYSTTNTHVDEVNVFYHVNYIHDYYKNTRGYSGMDYQMKATVHYGTNYANAFYSQSDKNIYFGDGDGSNLLQTSRACDVIYHEYTHGVTDHVYRVDTGNSSALPYTGQSGAIDEALSDYFPASVTNDPNMGEWVMAQQYQRNLEDLYVYPDDWAGEVHDDSRIISGAFWDIRKAVGQSIADKLIFEAEFYYPEDFLEFRNAVIQVDQNLYNGSHVDAIKSAFARHGIGDTGGGGTTSAYELTSTTYSWINTSTSTGITGDDQSKAFTLPFSFNFYGTTYNSVYVCSNGFLSFTSDSRAYRPADIPNTGTPNALIAPFWRDLTPDASGTITYTSTSSYFVVTWNNVKNYSNSNRQTFQVILYSNGEIVFQYKTVSNDVTTSIGIENQDGSDGVKYAYSSSAPYDYSAIKFTPVDSTGGGGSYVWTEVAYNISSPHYYENNYDNTWTITHNGALKMAVHFSQFDTESGYDFVYIYDADYNQAARYDGNRGAFWSTDVDGDVIRVRLQTDGSVTRYGFDIDKYAWYGSGKAGIVDLTGRQSFEVATTLIKSEIPYSYRLKSNAEITVFNIAGRLTLHTTLTPGEGSGLLRIPHARPGVYFVKVKGKGLDKSFKIVKIE